MSAEGAGGRLLARIARAYHGGEVGEAQRMCSELEGDVVFDTLSSFLALPQESSESRKQTLYLHCSAFTLFCSAGGNAELYHSVSSYLEEKYRGLLESTDESLRILDIGVGSGLALVPAVKKLLKKGMVTTDSAKKPEKAIEAGQDNIRARLSLDLVEPVQSQLSEAMEGLTVLGCDATKVRGHCYGLEEYVERIERHEGEENAETDTKESWSVAQATFAMHNLAGKRRERALRWLRDRCQTLVIVEFDQPHFDISESEGYHAKALYVYERYTEGLRLFRAQLSDEEYTTVMSYFLMPIMLAYFGDGDANRTHEQPIEEWVHQLSNAGFEAVTSLQVCPYWWAPCHAIIGSRRPDAAP